VQERDVPDVVEPRSGERPPADDRGGDDDDAGDRPSAGAGALR